MSNQDVVKFGDTFYLKHENGQYFVNVDHGRRNWPQLSSTGKVKLQLVGGNGEVTSGSPIKIRTTEEVTGEHNILGAFADSHDCYYWQDGYDNDKQSWRITKASGQADPIFYGDRVRISNISYSNQRLAPDTKNQGYITTVENAGDSWILEPVFVRVSQPDPVAQKPVSVGSVAQPDPVAQEPISVYTTTKAPNQYTAPNVAAADNTIMKDKIKHVVVVMLENRGFDSVLGYLYEPDKPDKPGDEPKHHIPALKQNDVTFNGLSFVDTEKLANPMVGKDGKPMVGEDGKPIEQKPVKGVRATNSPGWDPGEPYKNVNMQLFFRELPPTNDQPAEMKGFLQDYSTECKGNLEAKRQIMHMYTPADLPVLSSLAKTYAVSDMWFASVPTQTNANRAFSLCGTSMGLVDNGFLTTDPLNRKFQNDQFKTDTIWNVLYDHGFRDPVKDWAIFWHNVYPPLTGKPYTRNVFPYLQHIPDLDSYFHSMDDFFTRAKNGNLPAFSYIEPRWGGEALGMSILGNEYHCPADVTPGEHLLQQIYQSLTTNQTAWKQTLLVILFDEHGGTYDHVPPEWNATPPWGKQHPGFELQYEFQFNRFGVRVPAILVSPLIEEKTVFRSATNTPYDHTSLIATILKWKGISLTNEAGKHVLGERVYNAPTFDQVLTRTTPREDKLEALPSPLSGFKPKQTSIGTPLKFGEPFCLRHMSGEYVIGAESSPRAYFPCLGKGNPVHLDFRFGSGEEKSDHTVQRFGSGEVESGKTVQIRTAEYLEPNQLDLGGSVHLAGSVSFLGIRNFLGAWKDSHNCYYYSSDDTHDYQQQYWTVSNVDGSTGSICYGDKVYITNKFYENQRLTKDNKYLTTAPSVKDYWVIEPPVYQQTASHEVTKEMAKAGS